MADIDKNKISHTNFNEYKILKSFAIVQRIDDIVCKLYGLNDEETNYIKNYEIEYRINDTED